jgi:hypothetical protein
MYPGLTVEEREALAEVTRMGFPALRASSQRQGDFKLSLRACKILAGCEWSLKVVKRRPVPTRKGSGQEGLPDLDFAFLLV